MIHQFLSQLSLFRHLTKMQLSEICKQVKSHQFSKGQSVFSENQLADKLYIVYQGLFKIFKLSEEGKEQILQTTKPGDVIAEVPLFEGKGYPANCEALENSTLLSIARTYLIRLIRKYPDIALAMLALQAKRLREFTAQIENLTLKESKQRLINYLLDKCDDKGVISPKLSITNLSKHLGMTRENLSKILNKLAKDDYVVIEKDRIIIKENLTKH